MMLQRCCAALELPTDSAAKRRFQEECASFAERIEREGMPAMAELYCAGPGRVQYRDKDPRGWAEFKRQFAEGSARATRVP